MKFTRLNISNFRGIRNLDVKPEHKIMLAMSENGKGKTSLLEALRFALTGDTPAECFHNDAEHTTVAMTLADGTTFERTKYIDKPSVVRVNGKRTPAKNLDSLLEEKSGVSKTALKVTTSADIVTAMSPGEFGDFLLSYVPEMLDFDTVCGYIPGITPQEVSELSVVLPAMPNKFDMQRIKEAQTYVFDERKAIKKEIAVREAKTSTFTGSSPVRSRANVESDIREIMKLEGGYAATKTAMNLYESAVKARKAAEEDVKNLKEQIDKNASTIPNVAMLTDLQSKLKDARQQLVNTQSMLHVLKMDIETFTRSLSNLSKPICPLSDALVCTTDKTKVRTELEEMVKANQEGVLLQQAEAERLTALIATLSEKEQEWRTNERAYNEKVVLTRQYELAKKKVPMLPPKPADTEEKDFREELSHLQSELNAITAWEENEKILASLGTLYVRRDALDNLCKALDPKGAIITGIMAHYMSIFETVINDRAAMLRTGITAKFVVVEGVHYEIMMPGATQYRLYESLSHGEQTLAMFLLLDMLNTLCNTRILLMDDLNHLDKESFNALYALISSTPVQDAYDHIILCGVNNADIMSAVATSTDVDFIF